MKDFKRILEASKPPKEVQEWEDALDKLNVALRAIYKVVDQKEIMNLKVVHGSKDTPQRVVDQLSKVGEYVTKKLKEK